MPGFLAGLRVDRDSSTGVVLATNTTYGLDPTLGDELVELLEAHAPPPVPVWQPTAPPGEAMELVGTWYWGPTPIGVSAVGEELRLEPLAERGRASPFHLHADGRWIGLHGYYAGEVLRPVRRDDGTISHLDLASFILTRTPYDPTAEVPGGVDPGGWTA